MNKRKQFEKQLMTWFETLPARLSVVDERRARRIVDEWNRWHDDEFVPWEIAEEVILTWNRMFDPAGATKENAARHTAFALRCPDALLEQLL